MAISIPVDDTVRASASPSQQSHGGIPPEQAGPSDLDEPQCVEGWASRVHLSINDDGPSVIPSPAASAESLIAWALGQIGQLNVMLHTIGMAEEFAVLPPPSELAGAVRHQLEQIEVVLEAATGRLTG